MRSGIAATLAGAAIASGLFAMPNLKPDSVYAKVYGDYPYEEIAEEYDFENNNLPQIIDKFRAKHGLNASNFSMCYYCPGTGESYNYESDVFRLAASTYKLPLSIHFFDLIRDGKLKPTDKFKVKYVFEKPSPEDESGEDESLATSEPDPFGGTSQGDGGQVNTGQSSDASGSEAQPKIEYITQVEEVELSEMIKDMIVISANEPGEALIEYLGIPKYKEVLKSFSPKLKYPKEFYSDNCLSAHYLMDVLKKLYSEADKYPELIELLKEATPWSYFKKYNTNFEIAHKYGHWEKAVNDYGIFYTPEPFLLSCMTYGLKENYGIEVTGRLAELMTAYSVYNYNCKIALAEEETTAEQTTTKDTSESSQNNTEEPTTEPTSQNDESADYSESQEDKEQNNDPSGQDMQSEALKYIVMICSITAVVALLFIALLWSKRSRASKKGK